MPNPLETPAIGEYTVLLWSHSAGCYLDPQRRGWVMPDLIFLTPHAFHWCLLAPPGGLSKLQRIGVG